METLIEKIVAGTETAKPETETEQETTVTPDTQGFPDPFSPHERDRQNIPSLVPQG